MNYVTGHNMAGYLPETDPYITADWESARASLLDDLERYADDLASLDETGAEVRLGACDEAIADLKRLEEGRAFLAYIGHVAYWLHETDEMPEGDE